MACEFKCSVCGNKYHLKEDAEYCEHSHRKMNVYLELDPEDGGVEWKFGVYECPPERIVFDGVRVRCYEEEMTFSMMIEKKVIVKADIDNAKRRLVAGAKEMLSIWSKVLDEFEEKENLK